MNVWIGRSLANSLVFGPINGEKQIGLAALLAIMRSSLIFCDVFILEDYARKAWANGCANVHGHPGLQGLRRWTLATRDSHSLYSQFGWTSLNDPNSWMELLNPFPGEGRD